MYRLARATLHNDVDAQDALQEAYLRAYRSMATFRGDATLATWLSRLVLNECFARLRRSRRGSSAGTRDSRSNGTQSPLSCEEHACGEALAEAFDVTERDVFEFGGAHCDRITAAVLARLAPDVTDWTRPS